MTGRPRFFIVYFCPWCSARRELPEDQPPPGCGHLDEVFSETPTGWVRSQSWTNHGAMLDSGQRLDANPILASQEAARGRRWVAAREGGSVQGIAADGSAASFLPESVLASLDLMVEDPED